MPGTSQGASHGWDPFKILQIANPNCKDSDGNDKRTCPALTQRKKRCKLARDADSFLRAEMILNNMSVQDPSHFLHDDGELQRLADQVLCKRFHLNTAVMKEYAIGVWRRLIQDWIRAQNQVNHVHNSPIAVNRGASRDGDDSDSQGDMIVLPSIESRSPSPHPPHRRRRRRYTGTTTPASQNTRASTVTSATLSQHVVRNDNRVDDATSDVFVSRSARSPSKRASRSSSLQSELVAQVQQSLRITGSRAPLLAVREEARDSRDTRQETPSRRQQQQQQQRERERERSVTLDHDLVVRHSRGGPRRRASAVNEDDPQRQHEQAPAMNEIMRQLQQLTLRVQTLEEEKTTLRHENSRLVRRLAAMEQQQDVLEEQIEEQFDEINRLRED